MKTIDKIYLSWDDVEKNCQDLADKIKHDSVIYDIILSVGRGGLIPSRLLSEYLGIKRVEIYNVKSYTDIASQGKIISTPFNYQFLNNKEVLIVDDVYTTGDTMNYVTSSIYQNVDEIFIATCAMYYNTNQKWSTNKPDIWSQEYDAKTKWLVFPWEFDEDRK